MSGDNNSSGSGGIDFLGMLTIVFIALKLTGHIAWSWLLVLSPLWLPIALILGRTLVFLIYVVIARKLS